MDGTRRKELEDLHGKVQDARRAAEAPGASVREKSDLKLIEQDYVATQQKARHDHARPKSAPTTLKDKVEEKLDTALKQSFPGSDPVAVVQPTPVKKHDGALCEVAAKNHDAGTGKKD